MYMYVNNNSDNNNDMNLLLLHNEKRILSYK